jgi:hypothetical protein
MNDGLRVRAARRGAASCCCAPPRAGRGGADPGAAADRPIALTGGTIHTVTNGVIENGTIVFEDGRITAIGANVRRSRARRARRRHRQAHLSRA